MEVHVELAAEKLFDLGPIPVTNSMLTMFIVMGVLLLVFSSITRKADIVPGRGQGFLELIVEFLLGLVEGTAGKRIGRRIFPLIAGVFIFIAFSNYSGLLPGVGTVGYWEEKDSAEVVSVEPVADEATGQSTEAQAPEAKHERVLVPFFRAPNADLNMTLAMALLTFLVVQVAGVRAHGVIGRIKHMADPPFLFPLEVVQEFARIISLSFRLFGNIFAGEVLLAVMYAMANALKIVLIPLLFPVIFLGLEVLFGTVQALVFALLTLIYITMATSGGHDDTEAHESGHSHEPARDQTAVAAHGAGD